MTEKTITVSEAVESALATVAQRVEHEAGCATETDFSATCTCGLRDALNTLEAALASSTGPDPENSSGVGEALTAHRFRDEAIWLRSHGYEQRAKVLDEWAAATQPEPSQETKGEGR